MPPALDGKCVIRNVIYQATVFTTSTNSSAGSSGDSVSSNSETASSSANSSSVKLYVGSTGGWFKKRWYKHRADFRNKKMRLSTELSKYIWKLKDEGTDFKIKWKVLRKIGKGGGGARKVCSTCNLEKIEIAKADRRKCLNKRNELVGKCVHHQKLFF